MPRAQDDENFDYDNAHDETELGDLSFSMVDVNEEAQISSHGEVGGVRTGFVVPLSKLAPDILKSENISGCGFQWKAHMVVLSACDTARGQITSEGVLNLPRALMIAGVPCVVVSQWEVGDSSTCELMKGFYGELRSGKDVCSSLRAAMLKMMMKDGAIIPEWAPFFVCGSPTVCLPTELQAGTSSCEGRDCGTSSETKAEQRWAKCAFYLAFISIKLLSTKAREHLNVLQMESYTYLSDSFMPLYALRSICLENIVCKRNSV